MAEVKSYDPKKVNVVVDGTTLTGFSADGIITVSRSEDTVTVNTGCKGDTVYEENANEGGTVAITLMQTSASLSKLRSLDLNRKKFALLISDANDDSEIKISSANCRVTKLPDIVRGKNTATVTVNIYVPNLIPR